MRSTSKLSCVMTVSVPALWAVLVPLRVAARVRVMLRIFFMVRPFASFKGWNRPASSHAWWGLVGGHAPSAGMTRFRFLGYVLSPAVQDTPGDARGV
ncbi:hypothetical protein GCM10008939_00220 [Deinococcus aquiradiocola]|uniref:Uncharacterized protein n=1 Tax=Deinococcus aquiradiocola TaxID=393059 RepID=A0A917P3X8_9DEIO|nr:hypothetical protein GCM10008939_00220 [Deinococcus aquiradiocola]